MQPDMYKCTGSTKYNVASPIHLSLLFGTLSRRAKGWQLYIFHIIQPCAISLSCYLTDSLLVLYIYVHVLHLVHGCRDSYLELNYIHLHYNLQKKLNPDT